MVAVLLFVAAITLLAPAIASSAQPDSVEISGVPQAAEELFAEAMAEHDIAIEIVPPGREGLELTARLTDDGGLIERAISWTIMTPNGDTVYAGEAPEAAIATPPGDYAVSIRYGAVRLNSMVTLLEGNRLMVSYVLHAGAIRILPRVQNIVAPGAAPDSRIYSLEGRQRGRLVAISTVPGEVVRVPEGLYRVESAFDGGNARASTEVRVKAGRMSAVEIDHKAGVARLSYVGAPDAPVLLAACRRQGASGACRRRLERPCRAAARNLYRQRPDQWRDPDRHFRHCCRRNARYHPRKLRNAP